MVPRIWRGGKSFKHLANYLTHDPNRAETSERVGWTHTFNLANDHVPSAVDEMLWTYRAADLLKEESGIRAGGRTNEMPVKHFSLNWSRDDNPSREHMLETTEAFLRHMDWDEFQTVVVCHTDKHPHVHGMINTVHPVTGLKLNDDFERRKASTWAEGYELENGIRCENRLENFEDRQQSPTRPAWMAFKNAEREFEQAENKLRTVPANENAPDDGPADAYAREWKTLKDFQRKEREHFFALGREEFRELRRDIYQDVRSEFTPRWADYYAAAKGADGPAAFEHIKAHITADQQTELERRRDEACGALRLERDGLYRQILDNQSELRTNLSGRQAIGFDSEAWLHEVCNIPVAQDRQQDVRWQFGQAAEEVTARGERAETGREDTIRAEPVGWAHEGRSGIKSESSIAEGIGVGLGFSLISFAESLVDGFVGAKRDPKPAPPPERAETSPFDHAANDAREQALRDKFAAERKYYEEQLLHSRD